MIGKSALAALSATLALAAAVAAHDGANVSDPQIAHIAFTAGQLDIAAARQALAKSNNPKVRVFAETMVRDHQAVNAQALALVRKLGVTPEANPTSTALSGGADAKLRELARLEGADFDKAYARNEAAFHATVNEALRTTLIPGARNGELKSLLTTGLALFSEHQGHAEHLAAELR